MPKRKVPSALVNAPAGRQSTLYWPMAGMYFDSRATPAVPATNATASNTSTTVAAKMLRQPCQRLTAIRPRPAVRPADRACPASFSSGPHVGPVVPRPALHLGLEPRDRGITRIARCVDDRLMTARIVQTIGDEVVHALLPHVGEVHRRAGFVPIHATTRRVAPKMEIISAMMITISEYEDEFAVAALSLHPLSVASGITHSNRALLPRTGGGQLGKANPPPAGRRSLKFTATASVDHPAIAYKRMPSGLGLLFQGPPRRTTPRNPNSLYMPTASTATPLAMSASLIQR